jgi:hypothetical protein
MVKKPKNPKFAKKELEKKYTEKGKVSASEKNSIR